MPVLKICEYPDPILKRISQEVTSFDFKLKSFIDNVYETLYSHEFCVGLAAPQLGNLQKIVLIDVSKARRPQPGNGLLVMINPVILESSEFKIVREGCLSVPDFTANVKRAMNITVSYQDVHGNKKILTTTNFEAHAIQHEVDHLNGILFFDRIINPAADLFRRRIKL
jgi:peptide deformylase